MRVSGACTPFLAFLLLSAPPSMGGDRIVVPSDRGNPPITIQDAIDRAVDGDTVLVRDGVYRENIRFGGKKIVVASFDLLDNEGKHAERTVIRGGDQTGSPRPAVFFDGGTDVRSILFGFTVTGGRGIAANPCGPGLIGGGVAVVGGGGVIESNIIRENAVAGPVAAGGGVGVLNDSPAFQVIVRNNTIERNAVHGGEMAIGGGVFVCGTAVTFRENRVLSNAAVGRWVWGGGVDLEDPHSAFFPIVAEENLIADNSATAEQGAWGGGMVVWNGTVVVSRNLVTGNTALGRSLVAMGGGMHFESWQSFALYRVEENTVERNVAQCDVQAGKGGREEEAIASDLSPVTGALGGGISVYRTELTLLRNSLRANRVFSHSGARGAAAHLVQTTRSSVLRGNTFEGNTGRGGACLGTLSVSGVMDLTMCGNTFIENTVTAGGGIAFLESGFRLQNGVFFRNSAETGGAVYVSGLPTDDPNFDGGGSTARSIAGFLPARRPVGLCAGPLNDRADAPPAPQVVVNSTMYLNSAAQGPSIHAGRSAPVIFNSILWGVPARGWTPEVTSHASEVTVQYSNVRTGDLDGIGNISRPPGLSPEAGVLVLLREDSPCIGRGVRSVDVGGLLIAAPDCDCHGHCRPQPAGSIPDIGAEESVRGTPRAPTLTEEERGPITMLHQNYPNPFNPATLIRYSVGTAEKVVVKVYDLLGREVASLVDGMMEPGLHEVRWDASNAASGMYICTMTAGTLTEHRRLLLVR